MCAIDDPYGEVKEVNTQPPPPSAIVKIMEGEEIIDEIEKITGER